MHPVTVHIECFVQANDMTAYRLNCIMPYHVETNLCGMHMKQDKYELSVWCGNINTYPYNTYRVSCRNELVRDAYHAGQTSGNIDTYRNNTYRVLRADK